MGGWVGHPRWVGRGWVGGWVVGGWATVGGPWVDGSSGVFAFSDHDKDVPSCFRFAHPAEAIFLFSSLRTAHRGHLRLGGLGAWRLRGLEAWRAWSLEGLEDYWHGALVGCCLCLAMGRISQGLPSQPPTHPTPSHSNHLPSPPQVSISVPAGTGRVGRGGAGGGGPSQPMGSACCCCCCCGGGGGGCCCCYRCCCCCCCSRCSLCC